MSALFRPEFLEETLVTLVSEDKINFLNLYRAACLETSCPKSDKLTQRIRAIAADPNEEPEARVQAFAIIQKLALQGLEVNPFSGQAVAPTASATSLRVGYKFGIEGNPYIRAEDIYMGTYAPTDARGNSLGKTYHLFAAPQLQGTRTFNETSNYFMTEKDGFKVKNPVSYHKDLETALAKGGSSIEGKRFIPALDIVNGSDPNKLNGGKTRPENNMFALKETGDFKGSYTLTGSDGAGYVLSSSPLPDYPLGVRIAGLSGGHDGWDSKGFGRFSGRPCRVVEVNHLTL
jgi:hypothetical protein